MLTVLMKARDSSSPRIAQRRKKLDKGGGGGGGGGLEGGGSDISLHEDIAHVRV